MRSAREVVDGLRQDFTALHEGGHWLSMRREDLEAAIEADRREVRADFAEKAKAAAMARVAQSPEDTRDFAMGIVALALEDALLREENRAK